MLPLGHVQSLTVEYSQVIPRCLWTGLFGQMKEIRCLSLYGEKAALELPLALTDYHEDPMVAGFVGVGVDGRGYDLYLPKLVSLEITRMGFSRTDPLLFQRLRDCLSEREVGNVGVPHVTVFGWKDTGSELITQLEDMGVRVDSEN